MKVIALSKLTAIVLALVFMAGSVVGQVVKVGGKNIDPPSDASIRAPKEAQERAQALLAAGYIKEADAVIRHYRSQFPLDYLFRMLAFDVAFLQGHYEDIRAILEVSKEVVEQYRIHSALFNSTTSGLSIAAVEFSGIKTGRDREVLEKQLVEVALARRSSLPFGMVDDKGIHVDKQVLALILVHQSYGRNGKLLFDRAAKLAPNDTFILELKAKRLIADGEEAQAVEMYKKALKAKASEARIKYLKKELAEAEKMAEWRKRVGPRTDKKDGG
ncbi:MAG: hypothetical protein IT363_14090 [Methanoregulaceae archaeon]|jgi:hypothetical protein|nr:hypothetical protein [Methanoregulaceae archaeon]